MPELSDRDKAFLCKAQRTPRGLALVAGAFIAISLIGLIVMATRGPQLVDYLFPKSTLLAERLQAENASLRSLKPTTPLEQKLIDKLQQRNELVGDWSGLSRYALVLIVGTSLAWLFMLGLCLATQVPQHHRYLRIVDALREDARSGSGASRPGETDK